MFGFSATDVKKIPLSHSKNRKYDPVADCVADSSTNILFCISLRAHSQSEQESIDSLMDRLPWLTRHTPSIYSFFDCGCGKMPTIKTSMAKRYSITTIAASSGSDHPFLLQKEIN